tara:strand:+ start:115 stop:342 length:228 start_codon:yes stop_codon:yes gene_type:complete
MKGFFESIQWLFEEFLFFPFDLLRSTQLINWWIANGINFTFASVGFIAFVYWLLQLKTFNDNGEEDKDPSAHSFL